jgi:F0F1-type ATP synthase delta subunit
VWKTHKDQVRFDAPIEVDVESAQPLDTTQQAALAREIEAAVRAALQLRVAVSVLPPGGLPRNVYKNALLAVREPKGQP